MNITRRANFGVFLTSIMLITAGPAFPNDWRNTDDAISMELVGQVNNVDISSFQFGYLNFIKGIDRTTIFSGTPQNETTALFSFDNVTTTKQVIDNGPMRINDRVGTSTIYLDAVPDGDFTNPASFANGTPILAARLRHQVIVDTVTGSFTATFALKVTSTESFMLGDRKFKLGKVGQNLRLTFIGHLNATPPPAAHIAGFMVGGDLTRFGTD
jgi:hypothetical protein